MKIYCRFVLDGHGLYVNVNDNNALNKSIFYYNQYNLISSKRQQNQLQAKQASSMKGNRSPRGAKKVRKAGRGGR